MLSLADPRQYYQLFLSQGVGMGLGAGLMFVPALSVQTHYWRKRRALAMGIVLSGFCATSSSGVFECAYASFCLDRDFMRRNRLPNHAESIIQWLSRFRLGCPGIRVLDAWTSRCGKSLDEAPLLYHQSHDRSPSFSQTQEGAKRCTLLVDNIWVRDMVSP